MSELNQDTQDNQNKLVEINKEISDYYTDKMASIENMKKEGKNPYPHKYPSSMSLKNYIETYNHIEQGARCQDSNEQIIGRVTLKRDASKKLKFLTIEENGYNIQVMVSFEFYHFDETVNSVNSVNSDKDKLDFFIKTIATINRGDIIGISGFVGKSHKGELSIFPYTIQILTPCLRLLPTSHFGITDEETRMRKRFLDLLVNASSRTPFIIRNKVLKFIRNFLYDMEFIEVQTPIINLNAGGANAKKFTTYLNDLKTNMELRVAPELYLKQLVVGGFPRVYEIGPQFRNESIDRTHSPEFTSLEFYMAYADYNDLIIIAENLFSSIVHHIHGTFKIKCKPFDNDKSKPFDNDKSKPFDDVDNNEHSNDLIEIDFTPPFNKFDFVKEIELGCGKKLPIEFDSDESNLFLQKLCKEHNIVCADPKTTSRLLDKLAGHFIEPKCINPSFVINHPRVMCPLAKWHRDNSNLTERFEMFIMGYEFANAYTELNDPVVQRFEFEKQMKSKSCGDDEAQNIDETFIEALEYGLPPTGGFGMGIDRLIMILSGVMKIQDVITFPLIR